MSFSTPIVLLIFNRPKLTNILFEKIAQIQPQKLLVVADGPRSAQEAEQCEQCKAIIEKVDWDCEVLTNYSKINLGCKKRISSGLDWVFSQVEEAIILEDDCIPAPSFFNFCQTLLERYRHDERIMVISGDNFIETKSNCSYRFSKYNYIWGWASWSRAWKYYDVEMKSWPEYKQGNFIASLCEHPAEQKYWTDIFDSVVAGEVNSWAYQWTYTCWSQNGLSVLPNSNLISNIGIGTDATHTKGENSLLQLPTTDIWDIKHPSFIARDINADIRMFKDYYQTKPQNNYRRFLSKLKCSIYATSGSSHQ